MINANEANYLPLKRRAVSDASSRSSDAAALRPVQKKRFGFCRVTSSHYGGSLRNEPARRGLLLDPYGGCDETPRKRGTKWAQAPGSVTHRMQTFWKHLDEREQRLGSVLWKAGSFQVDDLQERIWKVYKTQVTPLELSTPTCSKLYSDILTHADFTALPLIMVVAQHERLGKDSFVAKLADADHFPTELPFWDTKFVFVTHKNHLRSFKPSPRRPNRGKFRYMGESGTEEKYALQPVEPLSDRCSNCYQGLPNQHKPPLEGSRPSVPLLSGREVGSLWDRLLNLDAIKSTFGQPFMDAHVCGYADNSPALTKFHVVSCPDVPEDPPPDYSYELALRYFAQKADRIYFLLDITKDIDERVHLAVEALADFQSRLALVYTSPEKTTDIGYWFNRYNFTTWNLAKIFYKSRPTTINNNPSAETAATATAPKIYAKLFAPCDVSCSWHAGDVVDVWADLRDLKPFQVARLGYEARRRAVVALVLATFHNHVFRTLAMKRRVVRTVSKTKGRLKQATLNMKRLLMPTQSGNWKRMNVGSTTIGSSSKMEDDRLAHREVHLWTALKQLEWTRSLDPEFVWVGFELLLPLEDALMYKEFAVQVPVDEHLMETGLSGFQKLSRITGKMKAGPGYENFDPRGSLGEGRAFFDEIIPVNERSTFDRTFQQAVVEQNTERISTLLITHMELPIPVPNGTTQRTIDITTSKSSEGVTRDEFVTIMHLTSMKTSGNDLPMSIPHRLVTPWRRKPKVELARCWFTEKGATKVPTAQQKVSGNFFMAQKKSYKHLLKEALGLKFGVGASGEEFGTIQIDSKMPMRSASAFVSSGSYKQPKSSWTALFGIDPQTGLKNDFKSYPRQFNSTPHIPIKDKRISVQHIPHSTKGKRQALCAHDKQFRKTPTSLNRKALTARRMPKNSKVPSRIVSLPRSPPNTASFLPENYMHVSGNYRIKSGLNNMPWDREVAENRPKKNPARKFPKRMKDVKISARNQETFSCDEESIRLQDPIELTFPLTASQAAYHHKYAVSNNAKRAKAGSDLIDLPPNKELFLELSQNEVSTVTNLESRTSHDVAELQSCSSLVQSKSSRLRKRFPQRHIHKLRAKLMRKFCKQNNNKAAATALSPSSMSCPKPLRSILMQALTHAPNTDNDNNSSDEVLPINRLELVAEVESLFYACSCHRKNKANSKHVQWNERVRVCGEDASETLCVCEERDYNNLSQSSLVDPVIDFDSSPARTRRSPVGDFIGIVSAKESRYRRVNVENSQESARVEAGTESSDDMRHDGEEDQDIERRVGSSSSAGPGGSNTAAWSTLELTAAANRGDEFGSTSDARSTGIYALDDHAPRGSVESVETPRRSGPGRASSLQSAAVLSPQPTSTPDPKASQQSARKSLSDSDLCRRRGESEAQRIARLLKFGFAAVQPAQKGGQHEEHEENEIEPGTAEDEAEQKGPKQPLQFGFVRIPEDPNKPSPQDDELDDCKTPSGSSAVENEPGSEEKEPNADDAGGGARYSEPDGISPLSKASSYHTALLRPGAGHAVANEKSDEDEAEMIRRMFKMRVMLDDEDLPPLGT